MVYLIILLLQSYEENVYVPNLLDAKNLQKTKNNKKWG
mgnify:CR=1 FL=1